MNSRIARRATNKSTRDLAIALTRGIKVKEDKRSKADRDALLTNEVMTEAR